MALIKTFKVGAQPIVDGVMIRGRNKYSIAMKKTSGNVLLDKNEVKFVSTLPIIFIRGIISSIESGILSIRSLLFSTEYFDNEVRSEGEDLIASKAEALMLEDEKKAKNAEGWLKFAGILIALGIATLLFFIIPPLIASKMFDNSEFPKSVYFGLLEGGVRILLYIIYLLIFNFLGGRVKSFRRYHAAEHKAINCFEAGRELTVENVKAESYFHPRCGFLILFYTIAISSIIFSFLTIKNLFIAILLRLVVLALSIGISYEISRLFGMFNGKVSRTLNLILGMWIEKFTVEECDDIEAFIALTALKTAMAEE